MFLNVSKAVLIGLDKIFGFIFRIFIGFTDNIIARDELNYK